MDGPARVAVLGQKLVQLTMPGVPDVYQGTEIVDLSLVDPDNRRPVDFGRRGELLATLDAGGRRPAGPATTEKLLVTSRALRLRREHPEWFVGRRRDVPAGGDVLGQRAGVLPGRRGRRPRW